MADHKGGGKILQGFGDFRPQLGPLLRTAKPKLGAGVQMVWFEDDLPTSDDSARFTKLRQMAQELSAGLRVSGSVGNHWWYHKLYGETFAADDAVRWIGERMREPGGGTTRALQLLQELLDHGFIRRVSKRESTSSIGWEATEYVVRSKRRFKHTKHTLYRFDDETSELQLRVEIRQAELEPLLRQWNIRRPKLSARVVLGDRVFETLAIKRDSSPHWRARFVFGLDAIFGANATDTDTACNLVHVSVLQSNSFERRELGSLALPVATLPRALMPAHASHDSLSQLSEFYRWYEIESTLKPDEDGRSSGSARIQIGCCIVKATTAHAARVFDNPRDRRPTRVDPSLDGQLRLSTDRSASIEARPTLSTRPLSLCPTANGAPLKTRDVVRGGVRHWRLCAFVDTCEGVRYDLAETYGLPWVMEVKLIVGSDVVATTASDRDRETKGATWGERLALDVYANQRVDDVKLVVCQRAKYDLMTRHVGAVSIPLSKIPVVEQGLPPPDWHNLQRMKHGTARQQLNGAVYASLWLRDIRPLESAPFGVRHILALDAALVILVAVLTRRLIAALVVLLVLVAPLAYLFRDDINFARAVGAGLTLLLKHVAPLGLELSFKSISLEARVRNGRLHVSAVVRDFAFGNPSPDHVPPSIMPPLWQRAYRTARKTTRTFARRLWLALGRRASWRAVSEMVATANSRFISTLLSRVHFDDDFCEPSHQSQQRWTSLPSHDDTYEFRRWASSATSPCLTARTSRSSVDSSTTARSPPGSQRHSSSRNHGLWSSHDTGREQDEGGLPRHRRRAARSEPAPRLLASILAPTLRLRADGARRSLGVRQHRVGPSTILDHARARLLERLAGIASAHDVAPRESRVRGAVSRFPAHRTSGDRECDAQLLYVSPRSTKGRTQRECRRPSDCGHQGGDRSGASATNPRWDRLGAICPSTSAHSDESVCAQPQGRGTSRPEQLHPARRPRDCRLCGDARLSLGSGRHREVVRQSSKACVVRCSHDEIRRRHAGVACERDIQGPRGRRRGPQRRTQHRGRRRRCRRRRLRRSSVADSA